MKRLISKQTTVAKERSVQACKVKLTTLALHRLSLLYWLVHTVM